MGDLSPHFSKHEFACRHCGRVVVSRHLVQHLEELRALVGRPLRIVSGYRCPTWNRKVGGAVRSRHLTGEAVDLEAGYATVVQADAAGFKGVGYRGTSAVHVDIRPTPARWSY